MNINDWKNEPKHHIDNVEGSISRELLFIGLFSGYVPFVFTFTPTHMKRIAQWFKYHVELYEKEYGPIKTEDWQPSKPSPFVPIKRPKKGGEESIL